VQEVQRRCRWCSLREGAGEVQVVQGGAGYLHRLHLSKHNIRCREVQGVQAHLSSSRDEPAPAPVEEPAPAPVEEPAPAPAPANPNISPNAPNASYMMHQYQEAPKPAHNPYDPDQNDYGGPRYGN
jgi:hypothetical protein